MKLNSEHLLNELIQHTEENIQFVETLQSLSDEKLNQRKAPNSWSILECLQHLNLYADFYHPEIENQTERNSNSFTSEFQPGFLGNYFVQSMLPKPKLKTMKTPKSMNPIFTNLDCLVLTTFIENQKQLLYLLEVSKTKNLTKIKTRISIAPLLKIRLGDSLRFIVFHNVRHVKQIQGILVG